MKQNVLMIGTSLETRGGVSAVERIMVANAGTSYRHVVSHRDGFWGKFMPFFVALSQIALANRQRLAFAHVHFSSEGSFHRKYLLTRLLALRKIPYILHAHGSHFHKFYETSGTVQKKRVVRMLSGAVGLIALSDSWADYYRSLVPSLRVFVLPNPVDWPAQTRPPEPQVPIALFTGRIGERKGAFDLIQAFAKLRPEQARLIMVGDGEVEKARAQAASLGLGDRVEIRPWVSDQEKAELLRTCNLFILPSHAEGLPMSLLEAMAHGMPVITTPVGGIPEVVRSEQNGLLVKPGDVDDIAAALGRLAGDPMLRRRLGNAARASMEPLAAPRFHERMLDIYNQVAATSVE